MMSDIRIQDYGLRQIATNRLELYIEASQEEDVRSNVEKEIHKLIEKNKLEPVYIEHISTWPKGGQAKKKRIEKRTFES